MSQSLLALACGDSYGAYFEMEGLIGSKFNIEKLPDKSLEITVTDDTKMASILLKHYKRYNNMDFSNLVKEYRHWAITEGDEDGIGLHTKRVLVDGSENKDSQGNGALMRNIPFGVELINDGYSFEDAVKLMNQDSALTHKNETIFMANRLALDLAVNGTEVLKNSIYQGILSRITPGYTAWVIHSLYTIIETLKMDLSFIEGFKHIVANGGDTDTNCAIYGAIKGANDDIREVIDIAEFLPTDFVEALKAKKS